MLCAVADSRSRRMLRGIGTAIDSAHRCDQGELLRIRCGAVDAVEEGASMGMSDTHVRRAVEADAPTIAFIYNQGIEERIATFETQSRTQPRSSRNSPPAAISIRPWSLSTTGGS